ncbi:hypothetical protein L596_030203 [Steinernema carpocapsae]|uniref:Uncharacterized protein n=1 Tax=Steinernema carpocapsae TaxID=34508 RepID=A0A4U5LS08_STECR|nr:hypothetical protein L596_030203 [Steinernema carpocapsae]
MASSYSHRTIGASRRQRPHVRQLTQMSLDAAIEKLTTPNVTKETVEKTIILPKIKKSQSSSLSIEQMFAARVK